MVLLDKFFHTEHKRKYEEQVVDHIRRLLNTKEDFGAYQKNFGLKGFSGNFSQEALARAIEDNIFQTIQKYEQRICVSEIKHINTDSLLNMRFRISCTIKGEKRVLCIAFENQKEQISVEVEE